MSLADHDDANSERQDFRVEMIRVGAKQREIKRILRTYCLEKWTHTQSGSYMYTCMLGRLTDTAMDDGVNSEHM